MPWSGEGESWICWRFPFPRKVAAVFVALPPEMLAKADLKLLAFSAAESFEPVEVQVSAAEWRGKGASSESVRGILLEAKVTVHSQAV